MMRSANDVALEGLGCQDGYSELDAKVPNSTGRAHASASCQPLVRGKTCGGTEGTAVAIAAGTTTDDWNGESLDDSFVATKGVANEILIGDGQGRFVTKTLRAAFKSDENVERAQLPNATAGTAKPAGTGATLHSPARDTTAQEHTSARRQLQTTCPPGTVDVDSNPCPD